MAMPFLKFTTLAVGRVPGVGVVAYVEQVVVCIVFGWLYSEMDVHLVWDFVLTTGWCEESSSCSCTKARIHEGADISIDIWS